ncbi:hypothetical protein N7448_003825 [Penicillium atrosanguineum]|nr:hypothetical protein N7448_003825 [Penicillium atrosanguineum]
MGRPGEWLTKFRRSRLLVITAISLSVFTDTFLYTMIVPIIPYTLKERVGIADGDALKWTSVFLTVFGLTNVLSSPVVGLLADLTSSRRVLFMLGLLVLGLSTILYWIGRTVAVLIAARALQGVSATVVWVIGLAIINEVADPDNLGASLSWVWSANTLGALSGPFIGGVLFKYFGYHSVFILATGLILVDMALRMLMAERSHSVTRHVSDNASSAEEAQPSEERRLLNSSDQLVESFEGTNTTHGSYTTFNSDRNSGGESKPTPAPSRSSYKLLLCYPRIATLAVSSAVNGVIFSAFETILPLYSVQLFHVDSARVGLFFFALSGPMLISPLFGNLTDRYGTKWTAVFSTILLGVATILMGTVNHNDIFNQVLLGGLLFLCGVGCTGQRVVMSTETGLALQALVNEPSLAEAELRVENLTGQAYGVLGTASGIGVTLGPVLSGWLRAQSSWMTTVTLLGFVAIALAIPSVMYTGGRLRCKGKCRSAD